MTRPIGGGRRRPAARNTTASSPRPVHTRRPRLLGLTIIELLVIITLLALLAALVHDVDLRGNVKRLDFAELRIADALQRARGLALSTGRQHAVVFDVDDERFTIVDDKGVPITDHLTRRPFLVDFTDPGLPLRIAIDSADFGPTGTAAIFDARGMPRSGGAIRVSRNGTTVTLALDGATGRIDQL